jgi:hypothetical protein
MVRRKDVKMGIGSGRCYLAICENRKRETWTEKYQCL